MVSHSIALKMEGPKAAGGHLELSVLSKKVEQFYKLLNSCLKGADNNNIEIRVVNLSHSSPFTLECQLLEKGALSQELVRDFSKKLDSIDARQTSHINDAVLSAAEKLAKPNPNKIARTEIVINGGNGTDSECVHSLDDKFLDSLMHARSQEYAEIGTLDGVLEEVNIHGRPPYTCRIYDAGFASATIKCSFSEDLLEEVKDALGSGVFVTGELLHRPDTSVPYKINVQKIKKLPPSEELPSLSDLKGIAPDITGDKTPEEFVRESRNQW